MSVLIKGMKMPERCEKCFMCQSDCMGCKVTQNFIILKKGQNKPSWCPLIEVPPHGRLIDADALNGKMYHDAFETDSDMQKWDSGCWVRYKMFENNLRDAPTIIEAEGEENG